MKGDSWIQERVQHLDEFVDANLVVLSQENWSFPQ